MSITVCTILLGATFYCRVNLENQEILPTKIETISPIKLEVNKEIPINNKNIIDVIIKDSVPIRVEEAENNLIEIPEEEKNGK